MTLGHAPSFHAIHGPDGDDGQRCQCAPSLRVVVPGGGVRNASVLLASRATISSTFSAVAGGGSTGDTVLHHLFTSVSEIRSKHKHNTQ